MLKIIKHHLRILGIASTAAAIVLLGITAFILIQSEQQVKSLADQKAALNTSLTKTEAELKKLQSEDQYVINKKDQEEIKNIQTTYDHAVSSYEKLTDLKVSAKDTSKYDKLFALSLKQLSQKNYTSAQATLADLEKQIESERSKLLATAPGNTSAPLTAPASNNAPASGYARQSVNSDVGSFVVDIISADLGSTRVIVDTASDSDCHDNCPVMSLGDYVGRSGAYAGVNGSYFCPAEYPSCAGKTGSFDTLAMNKNKHYLNSDNNIYSTVPAVIFGSGWVRFVGRSSDWGRDTSVDGVLANQPLLVSGGNVVFGGDGDPKKGGKGNRSFVGSKGNTVYIGVAHNVTVAEMAHVLKTLGMDNALNLDSGGSTALWSGGYKVGPGRGIPNAILFVRK